MTLVLSQSDLARMKRSVQSIPEDTSAQDRRAELKRRSEERVKNWPNTLEALRKKKENFLKDREEQEEKRRQEIDKQEAELRAQARLETIRKANDLLYEQTDKMKMLRSQQLYADVVYSRGFQIEEKKSVKEREKEAARKHHESIMRSIEIGEQQEKEKIDQRTRAMEEVKVSRKDQLDEIKAIREAHRQRVIEDGLRMKRDAEERLQEDIRNHEARQKYIAETNVNMVKANEDLKRIKNEMQEKERLEMEEREKEIEKIDARKAMLKNLEKVRFEKAQVTRQQLIDAAVKRLAEKTNTEQMILEQQMQDMKDKEDRILAEKKMRNEAFRAEIAKSRVNQIEARESERRRRFEEEDVLLQKWKKENEDAMERETEKQRNARLETIKVKQQQYDDGAEAARKKREAKLLEIEQSKFLNSIRGNDDEKFIESCKKEIEKNIALGKPVYTLLRALDYSQPSLIAAKTVKVEKKKAVDA